MIFKELQLTENQKEYMNSIAEKLGIVKNYKFVAEPPHPFVGTIPFIFIDVEGQNKPINTNVTIEEILYRELFSK